MIMNEMVNVKHRVNAKYFRWNKFDCCSNTEPVGMMSDDFVLVSRLSSLSPSPPHHDIGFRLMPDSDSRVLRRLATFGSGMRDSSVLPAIHDTPTSAEPSMSAMIAVMCRVIFL